MTSINVRTNKQRARNREGAATATTAKGTHAAQRRRMPQQRSPPVRPRCVCACCADVDLAPTPHSRSGSESMGDTQHEQQREFPGSPREESKQQAAADRDSSRQAKDAKDASVSVAPHSTATPIRNDDRAAERERMRASWAEEDAKKLGAAAAASAGASPHTSSKPAATPVRASNEDNRRVAEMMRRGASANKEGSEVPAGRDPRGPAAAPVVPRNKSGYVPKDLRGPPAQPPATRRRSRSPRSRSPPTRTARSRSRSRDRQQQQRSRGAGPPPPPPPMPFPPPMLPLHMSPAEMKAAAIAQATRDAMRDAQRLQQGRDRPLSRERERSPRRDERGPPPRGRSPPRRPGEKTRQPQQRRNMQPLAACRQAAIERMEAAA